MKKKEIDNKPRRIAQSPKERQDELIALAFDQAEARIRNGTASASEIVHFLKLAAEQNDLKKEKLEEEVRLLRAKTEALESGKRSEEQYAEAIQAMKKYSGYSSDEDDEDDDEN